MRSAEEIANAIAMGDEPPKGDPHKCRVSDWLLCARCLEQFIRQAQREALEAAAKTAFESMLPPDNKWPDPVSEHEWSAGYSAARRDFRTQVPARIHALMPRASDNEGEG